MYYENPEFNSKPGDMIEWVYKFNNNHVIKGEMLWSSTMCCYVLIDEPSLLISITNEHYMWLNSKGLFCASIDDTEALEKGVEFAHGCSVRRFRT